MKWVSKLAGLPDDAAARIPRITIIGQSQVAVYNANKLERFTDRDVQIQLAESTLRITGKSLEVKELLPDEVVIKGKITGVSMKGKHLG